MKDRRWLGLITLPVALVALWLFWRWSPPVTAPLSTGWGGGSSVDGSYARADGTHRMSFPADHGPHPDFQTEWWYYTGNLQAAGGRRFGFQLTFFRRALEAPDQRHDRASAWATDQVYMAHFALTDVTAGRHLAFERLSRGAAGLAGAQSAPYRVWLQDWYVEAAGPLGQRLQAAQPGLSLDLLLANRKGPEPTLHGDGGYSRKGPDSSNASYYYSYTRLDTTGSVRLGDVTLDVTGLCWMDHEFSTSALGSGQVGWDWLGLQLDDDTELMVYQLRRADGVPDAISAGTFVAADGSARQLARDEFHLVPQGAWRSPRSGVVYPARWRLESPPLGLTLDVEPLLDDQELDVSFRYWEGAVRVSGERGVRRVTGSGYVELTGYASSMQGRF